MVDHDAIHAQIRDALNDGDVNTIISLVRDNDIEIDFRDVTHDLQTVLMRVCYATLDTSSLQLVLEAIFDKYPDVNIQDSWGRTVLMHACIANRPNMIEGLLDYEPTDVGVIDFEGNSALTYAVQNCDVFTVEDILQHPSGPKLLTIHNAKGQSPLTLGQKSGDKGILKLFEAYKNKTIGLREKRNRKLRRHDVIRLPNVKSSPAKEEQTERYRNKLSVGTSGSFEHESHSAGPRFKNRLLNVRVSSDKSVNTEKCDSAPVRRTNRPFFEKEEVISSLSLSSPRIERKYHKQNCLLGEDLSQSLRKHLPPMEKTQSMNSEIQFPEGFRKQRRPSISLPDLRNVAGCLVNSGSNTPNASSGVNTPDLQHSDQEDDDDVFARSYPHSGLKQMKNTKKHRLPERQLTLPNIQSGLVTVSASQNKTPGFTPLTRQRKFSTSDDQLCRATVLQDSR